MTGTGRILVAGIGNIFLGDDAFGVEAVQELAKCTLPAEVTVTDFGIRGYDLAYAIMDEYEATILVDATVRGNAPGTVYLIELDQAELAEPGAEVPDGHSLDPVQVLRLVRMLGGQINRLYLVGCEPTVLESEDGNLGLSDPVRSAIPQAVQMIQTLANDLLTGAR